MQFYPDDTQEELTSGYNLVALTALVEFRNIINNLHKDKLPGSLSFENMWNYLAYTASPDGLNILNNDTDEAPMKEDILKNAPLYNRKDWLYIFSNGKEGTKPAGYASGYYNYARQLVSRSGWTKDDQWSFFDVGPTGVNGHQHYDKLHISTYAYGRPLLVDNGRFTHKWDNWRQ